eukprot:gene9446-6629_t
MLSLSTCVGAARTPSHPPVGQACLFCDWLAPDTLTPSVPFYFFLFGVCMKCVPFNGRYEYQGMSTRTKLCLHYSGEPCKQGYDGKKEVKSEKGKRDWNETEETAGDETERKRRVVLAADGARPLWFIDKFFFALLIIFFFFSSFYIYIFLCLFVSERQERAASAAKKKEDIIKKIRSDCEIKGMKRRGVWDPSPQWIPCDVPLYITIFVLFFRLFVSLCTPDLSNSRGKRSEVELLPPLSPLSPLQDSVHLYACSESLLSVGVRPPPPLFFFFSLISSHLFLCRHLFSTIFFFLHSCCAALLSFLAMPPTLQVRVCDLHYRVLPVASRSTPGSAASTAAGPSSTFPVHPPQRQAADPSSGTADAVGPGQAECQGLYVVVRLGRTAHRTEALPPSLAKFRPSWNELFVFNLPEDPAPSSSSPLLRSLEAGQSSAWGPGVLPGAAPPILGARPRPADSNPAAAFDLAVELWRSRRAAEEWVGSAVLSLRSELRPGSAGGLESEILDRLVTLQHSAVVHISVRLRLQSAGLPLPLGGGAYASPKAGLLPVPLAYRGGAPEKFHPFHSHRRHGGASPPDTSPQPVFPGSYPPLPTASLGAAGVLRPPGAGSQL